MSQSVKAMIVVAALVVVGVAANQFSRAQARAVGSACRYGSNDRQRICYSQLLSDHLTRHGVADAVATLDAIVAADPDVAEHAHEYAHGLGIEAYSTSPDIAATFSACGDGFSSGCRHGVIQAYFESREQVTQPEVEALCQPFRSASASRWVLFQCVHGMGHGLTMFRGHDLPQALTDCDLLSDGWDRESCYGGAFMENVINVTSPHHPATELAAHGHHHMAMSSFKAIDPADPLYPCSIVAERVRRVEDRKSTRLNSSHRCISYAVFCLKKKTETRPRTDNL